MGLPHIYVRPIQQHKQTSWLFVNKNHQFIFNFLLVPSEVSLIFYLSEFNFTLEGTNWASINVEPCLFDLYLLMVAVLVGW